MKSEDVAIIWFNYKLYIKIAEALEKEVGAIKITSL